MNTINDRRWPALYVLCAGVLMIILDTTIVNVALPSIQDDLGFSQGDLAWIVNAYLIAFGGLLMLAGRIGDLAGRRRVFLIGLAVFTGASLVCGAAQSQAVLIGARFVQGAGGALTSAVVLGMIVTMFPEPREQAKAIGVYGFVASAGGSIGLIAGGVLTDVINWHWIFFVNLPIGVATAVLARKLVEEDAPGGRRGGADAPGAALLTGGLMLGVYTILETGPRGWGSAHTLVLGALSLALVAAFVVRQGRVADPLVPLRLFRSRNVTGANVVMALWAVGMFGMFFLGALYLQRILGYDALAVGLAFLPVTVVMGTLSLRYAGPLQMRFGPRALIVPSLVSILAGLLLFARAPVDGDYVTDVLPVTVLLGLGAGVAAPALMSLAMSTATPSDSGLASGLINTTVQVGGALGLAVLATLAGDRTEGLLAGGASEASALTSGFHLALLVGALLTAIAIPVAAAVLRPVRPAPAAEPEPVVTEEIDYREAA
ncbi:MAG TPA: DHA2 family efflux MFS transporter permease subunit [Solirubrobacteraceae bacterium]|nr:DHA2 family efflux MFS transporter permease subunit [Solirubrobacteraceae bacterium]